MCFKAELFYFDKGRRGVSSRQQQERSLGAARAIEACTPIVGLKEEGVHFLSKPADRTQGRMRGQATREERSER